MASVAIIGTCDTKLQELLYLRQKIIDLGEASVILIDVGRSPVDHSAISISQREVLAFNKLPKNGTSVDVSSLPRGKVIEHMIQCATHCIKRLHGDSRLKGIVSAGGSGGSSLVSAVMREALPIGFPKLLVSTVASGDTGPLVGETDITMMYSVVDIAGSNPLLRNVLANAAGAIVGMVTAYSQHTSAVRSMAGHARKKKRVGVTMFGVTTPCVDAARQLLETEHDCEVFVFHATGHGGKAMERLVHEGPLDAVLDITTTEICDYLVGGVMSAGPTRLEAAAKAGIPYVVSVGATDMVNFGPKDTVPEKYRDRQLLEHNPTVTLMRTNEEECRQVGNFIVEKLKAASKPDLVKVVLPTGGVSILATPNGPFADPRADDALFRTIEDGLAGSDIVVSRNDKAINDKGFAHDVTGLLVSLFTRE